jgi:tripartite-type tricarboxylate transporter receptor subunit TctC
MMNVRAIVGAFLLAAAMVAPLCAQTTSTGSGQAYPAKPVRLILPFPPGGPTDLLGRVIAQKLSDQLGQPVVVDNRGGAGGNLGVELAAKSPPDGYTLVLSSPLIAISPSLYVKLNYDPMKDLAPVSLVAYIQNVMLVHPSVPAKTLKEFIQLARANPGKLNFGTGGSGTTTHLAAELLKVIAKIDMVHVPYKGTGLALIGLVGGQVDMLVMAAPAANSQIQAGKVRALAVLSAKRISELPNVPTAKEAGVDNFEVPIWYGILAPAATSRDIINRLNADIGRTLALPDVRQQLSLQGIAVIGGTPEQFAAHVRKETAKWAEVIRRSGAKAD